MTTVIARWKIKKGQLETVRELLNQMVSATRAESGNLCYDLYHSADAPENILLFEQYTDEAAFAAHRAASHFQSLVLEKLIPLLESRSVQVFNSEQ
jgi:quinol monooxygenase YgiN